MADAARLIQPGSPRKIRFLPTEILSEASRRLGWAALVVASLVLATVTTMEVMQSLGIGACPPWHRVVYTTVLAGSVGVYLLSRTRLNPQRLLDLGLIYELLVVSGVSYLEATTSRQHGGAGGLSWVAVLIVLFPVLVPATPFKTFVAAVGAALVAQMTGVLASPSLTSVDLFSYAHNYLAAVLSVVPSLLYSRLGDELQRTRKLGQYLLEERLGEGGMGEVWKASHSLLLRPSVIKLVHPAVLGADPSTVADLLARFTREARTTAALCSPHTVRVYDAGTTDQGLLYYVMELMEGVDLETLVLRHGPLPPARVAHILIQACDSLAEAHAMGLVHRDVKPSNLFLCRVGLEHDVVKVLDFGLVTPNYLGDQRDPRLTLPETVFGTPAYMAPEQASGHPVDGRSDIYSLGCVGYWLLSGHEPFGGSSPIVVLSKHLLEPPAPVFEGRGDEANLEGVMLSCVILACLEKDPDDRPQSALELKRRLEALGVARDWTQSRARDWWETGGVQRKDLDHVGTGRSLLP